MSNIISQFKQTLQQFDTDYILYSCLPSPSAHCKFLGYFESYEVIWNTQIIALKHASIKQIDKISGELNAYLDVGTAQQVSKQESVLALRVGLPVNLITVPIVLKTKLMILNYKRLHRGIHAFGRSD